MTIAFLATIAAQMGSAWINSSRSKSHSKKMAELQRAYEEKAAIEGRENARAEFAELCSFQREIETQTHKDRLELIKKNHEQTLYQVAYERSLNKWPLLVPPYVIANAPLTIGANMEQCIPLNCIFTTSDNLSFNRHVFSRIEEQIAVFCCKYWNVSANKSIRFFQEAWKDTTKDVGPLHKDIYAHLKSVPTLLISPILKDEKILFRFYWWGLSLDPTDAHVDELNELNPELSISITSDTKFDSEISNIIVEECVPKLEAFISFFADLYYWNFYKASPKLPQLLANASLELKSTDSSEYVNSYIQQISQQLDNSNTIDVSSELDYIETLAESASPKEISSLVSKASMRIHQVPSLSAHDIIRISEFSQEFGSSSMAEIANGHLLAKIEEIELIEDIPSLTNETLISFVKDLESDAVNASCFAFIDWSQNMYIGTFCDDDFNPCIYSESNTIRFFVFRSIKYSLSEVEFTSHLLNIIPIAMSPKDSNPSGRERLGRRLINLGNRLCGNASNSSSTKKSSPANNAWGDAQSDSSYDLSTVINFFIDGVDNNRIHFTKEVSNMSLSDVLNWLDNLSDYQVGDSNQVYIIRGEYKQRKRILYCAFLAKDDKFDLSSATKECFICEAESEEMKEAFSGKSIYVIPFED